MWVTSSHSLEIKEEERKRQPSYSWHSWPVMACLLSFSHARPPCHGEPPPLRSRVQHIFSLFSCFFMTSCHSNGTANKHTLCWSRAQIQAHWPSKSDLNNFPMFCYKKTYGGFVQRLLTTWAWVPRTRSIRPSWEIRVDSTNCRQSPFHLHWDQLDQLEAMTREGRLTCMIRVTSKYSQPQS